MRVGALAAAFIIAGLSTSSAYAQPVQIPLPISVPDLEPGTPVRPVSFTRMVAKLSRGQSWGQMQTGFFCAPAGTLSWRSGTVDVKTEDFDDIFREEVTKAGFSVDGDPSNLFEQTSSSSEYAVAGTLQKIQSKLCFTMAGFGDYSTSKGNAIMEVEWQIYSRVQRKVIARINTKGGFESKKAAAGGFEDIIYTAFAENVKGLIVSSEFRNTFIGSERDANHLIQAEKADALKIALNDNRSSMPINDAIGAVVAVFAGDGHGSGALISTDGHILTNHHVVGGARFVKVRWSDGYESLGEVLRSHKGRDVALIKVEPRSRTPLAIRANVPQPGEAVFAIGTPLDPKFQSTVTKGIVSSNRIFDGYNFIQSDVAVNPGNSGGPLVDENGTMIGITVSGIRNGGASVDINLFIPIRDAFDFLALEPHSKDEQLSAATGQTVQ